MVVGRKEQLCQQVKLKNKTHRYVDDYRMGSEDKTMPSSGKYVKLSTQLFLLFVPLFNFALLAAIAINNARLQSGGPKSLVTKVRICVYLCTAVFGVLFTGYFLLLMRFSSLWSGPMPILVGVYVCNVLMGISSIVCQKVFGILE